MASSGFGLSGDQMSALLAGLGGIAGGIATPTNGSSSSQGSTQSSTSSDTQSLINQLLSSLSSSTSTGGTTGTTTGTGTTTSTGGFATPEATALSQKLATSASGLAQPVNLTPYQSQQTESINNTANSQQKQADSSMAARGLATSPVAQTTDANIAAQRTSQINSLNEGLPVLQQQLNLQNLSGANSILANQAKTTTGATTQAGTTSGTSTGSTTGSTTQSGTTASTGGSSTSGATSTQQSGTSKSSTGGGIGGLAGGLGGVLAALFG